MEYILKGGNVFYQDKLQKLDVKIKDTKIVEVATNLEGSDIIDVSNKLVMPGLVDLHVHLREPGFEHKGTIKTETLSAMYGGYTHLVAMANTKPCMDDQETIDFFKQKVKEDASVKTYTYSAITKDLAGKELVDIDSLVNDDIVLGFSDDGKGLQDASLMEQAMEKTAKYNSIIVAHEEDESQLQPGACVNLSTYSDEMNLVGINNASEYNHAIRDLKLATKTGSRHHICHISTKETVAGLREERKHNNKVSGEVCPHHLILTDENIKTLNPNYKMNPPLRSKEDLDALIEGLNDGTVTCISTDHAPHSEEEKKLPIDKSPFGIIGNQHAFSLVYTYLVKKNLISLETAIRCMTTNPSKVIGIDHEIEVGKCADICVFDLEKEYTITKDNVKSKACNTPFIDTKVNGELMYHILDGKITKI